MLASFDTHLMRVSRKDARIKPGSGPTKQKEDFCAEKDNVSNDGVCILCSPSPVYCLWARRKGKCTARKCAHFSEGFSGERHHGFRTRRETDFCKVRSRRRQTPTIGVHDEGQ